MVVERSDLPIARAERGERPLVVAVPLLHTYTPHSGIGRVLYSLRDHWGERVRLVDAPFDRSRLPLLRTLPFGVCPPAEADLVLLPQLTGAQALRRTRGRPSLAIIHDIGIVDAPADRAGMGWLARTATIQSFYGLRHASRLIVVSHFTAGRLLAHLPDLAGRISVVPNGVGPTLLEHRRTQAEARRLIEGLVGRALETPLLLNVGSEAPRKNIPLLLRVFKRIKETHPAALLIKVGSPGTSAWRTNTLRAAEQAGLAVGKDLLLLEQISDAALPDLYAAADLFVSTSSYEGFGLPALEALAVGTPVVVAACGALPEVVGDVGRVAPPDDGPLSLAVLEALCEPAGAGGAQRRRAWARQRTWARAAADYLDLLNAMRAYTT